jgi:Flp pilus assembly protein TadG
MIRLLPRRGKLMADRRGAAALMFAVSLTAVLGIIGLATEVGT